jgi:uncharacterized protein YrrD
MAIRNWSELRGLPVVIPSEGRSTGTVEDFYYKLETNSIYALRVKSSTFGVGYRILSSSAVRSIERDAVTVASDTMLIAEANSGHLLELPTGSSLLSCVVKNEDGDVVGKVGSVLVATDPPIALRIAAYQLENGRQFSANEVTEYDGNVIYILNKAASRL